MSEPATLRTRCCIAGGGPAGMMLGYLLARAGIDVVVLEKHGDFLRDFRGDTVHPSTLQIMDELGLLDAFLTLPHQEIRQLSGQIGGVTLPLADFRHVPGRCKFVALVPQWDFLDFLAARARALPQFRLLMRTEATELRRDGERIIGVRARTADGAIDIDADLVVAADGRHSTLRRAAGLASDEFGAPIDVVWTRVSRHENDPGQTFGIIEAGKMLVMLNRLTYYQCAYVIPKGEFETIRARGIEAFRAEIAGIAPVLRDRVAEIRDWNDVSLLTVRVDRLRNWALPGLLCIGDAAHAMSPIAGVGINLAIQDAVATANLLAPSLQRGAPSLADLQRVQRRRQFPTRVTQAMQVFIQDRVVSRVLASQTKVAPPAILRVISAVPLLRSIPAFIVGVGVRPEHVRYRRAL